MAGKSKGLKDEKIYLPTTLIICIGIGILFLLLAGAGVMATSLYLNVLYSDIDDLHFHLWIAIPVLVIAVLAIAAVFTRHSLLFGALFTMAILVFVISTYGAVTTGLAFHENNWRVFYEDLTDGKCVDAKAGGCNCPNDYLNPQETKDMTCEDLEAYVKLWISDIALSAICSLSCLTMVMLSMSAIWCRPWVHLGNYDGRSKSTGGINQDFENGVQITRSNKVDTFNRQLLRS